jgi:TadE-like protein
MDSKNVPARLSSRLPRKSRERGSALLEYAFAMVVTFVLIFGMIDFALALYSYHFVSEAAREATRFASVRGHYCSPDATPCQAQPDDIIDFVMGIVPAGINPAQVTVPTPTWTNPNNLPVCNTFQHYPGCAVQVEVDYDFKFLFPVNFYNLSPVKFGANTIHMSSTSQMIISR